MAPAATDVVAGPPGQPPHQLDPVQSLKASTALLKHLSSEATAKDAASGKRSLLGDGEPEATTQAVWCMLTTKKHIVDQKRLKPSKIPLPHTLNRNTASVCLIVPDPQRAFKDVVEHAAFPKELASQLRILGVTKLKQRYKSFEARRQLHAEYDVFLADDRAVTLLPGLLGKIFYESPKRPVPVRLEAYRTKDAAGKKVKQNPEDSKSALPAAAFAKEIEKALGSARVHLSPSVTTSVQVGWSHFTPQQIADNVQAVVDGMVEKFVTKGWRNVRAIHIKGPNSAALPIWMSEELWVDEQDVLDEAEAERAKKIGAQKGTKRKGRELEIDDDSGEAKKIKAGEEGGDKKKKAKGDEEGGSKKKAQPGPDDGMSKDMAARRQALRQQKQEAREETDKQEQKELKKKAKKPKHERGASISSKAVIAAPG